MKDDRADGEGHRETAWQTYQRERVIGERDGDRGNRPGGDHQHQRPAVEKCGQRAKRLPQVDVTPARPWAPLSQLAPAKRANERDGAAQHPHEENCPRGAKSFSDGCGCAENPAPDDPTDDGHRPGEQAEATSIGGGHRRCNNVGAQHAAPLPQRAPN